MSFLGICGVAVGPLTPISAPISAIVASGFTDVTTVSSTVDVVNISVAVANDFAVATISACIPVARSRLAAMSLVDFEFAYMVTSLVKPVLSLLDTSVNPDG